MRLRSGAIAITVATGLVVSGGWAHAAATQRRSGPFVYATASDPAPAGDFAEVAFCPPGFTLTGGGAAVGGKITDVDDHSRVTGSTIGLVGGTWQARGLNDLTTGAHAAVAAAVCLSDAVPITSSLTSATTPAPTGVPVRFANNCTSGTRAIVGGLDTFTPTDEQFLTASFPQSANAWFVEATNESTARSATGRFICASSSALAIRLVSHSTIVRPSATKRVSASCPRGFRVSSGGFAAGGDFNEVRSSLPFDGRDRDRAPDDGWRVTVTNTDSSPVAATAYAMCMRVRR